MITPVTFFPKTQAELDELRAKRAADEYERAWRAKERAEAARKHAMLDDIMRSREEMAHHRQQVHTPKPEPATRNPSVHPNPEPGTATRNLDSQS